MGCEHVVGGEMKLYLFHQFSQLARGVSYDSLLPVCRYSFNLSLDNALTTLSHLFLYPVSDIKYCKSETVGGTVIHAVHHGRAELLSELCNLS